MPVIGKLTHLLKHSRRTGIPRLEESVVHKRRESRYPLVPKRKVIIITTISKGKQLKQKKGICLV
jgi:hypothetical protein